MNKKGFLLGEETVKIILSVIAILFLILFIVYLYNSFTDKQDLQYANDSLRFLVSQIDSGSTNVQIYNPSNWIIASFPSVSASGGIGEGLTGMPRECSSLGWKSCICIYSGTSNLIRQGSIVSFDISGSCQPSNFNVSGKVQSSQQYIGTYYNEIIITPPLNLTINQQTKTIQKNGP